MLINRLVSPKVRSIFKIVLAIIILNSVSNRIVFSWNNDVHPLLFFTIQSNLMIAMYWLLSPFIKKLNHPKVHLYVTTYMAITGFIFIFFLDYGFTEIIYEKLYHFEISDTVHYYSMITSVITHYVMPILAVLDFLIFSYVKEKKGYQFVLIYPLIYFSISMIVGSFTSKYPYPFLDPVFMEGYVYVLIGAVMLTVIIVLMARLLIYLNQRYQNKMEQHFKEIIKVEKTV